MRENIIYIYMTYMLRLHSVYWVEYD